MGEEEAKLNEEENRRRTSARGSRRSRRERSKKRRFRSQIKEKAYVERKLKVVT